MKILKDMVVKGTFVIAQNVRKENDGLVADGVYNVYIDDNGNCHKKTEYIVTDDGDCVKLV